ncbi:MAG TPA: ABC transporter permease [Abditibacteriaceae bacterium]
MPSFFRLCLPWFFGFFLLLLWTVLTSPATQILPASLFPGPADVARSLYEETRNGRLGRDVIASLFRVAAGFGAAIVCGVPVGLWLGHSSWARAMLLPFINFMRALSPLAWIPFAIFWFGIGDAPAIFLIFGATFFPIVLSTLAAVAAIPEVYFRVARENGCHGFPILRAVTFPAILPSLVTALRVSGGLAWLVVVAAEIVAGRDGLGYLIWDARNGLRVDLLVAAMLVIGAIGILLDLAMSSLRRLPEVRWGHEN